MRQVMGTPGSEYYEEFRKDFYTKKPKITQTMNTSEIDSQFVFDMSNSDYSTSGTAGTLTHTFNILDPTVPGDFDMATDKQVSTITGGMYTYTDGTGNGGSGGTYNYMDGGFNLLGIDWGFFKNP